MARADLDIHFARVEKMVKEISQFVPDGNTGTIEFRADLAGLLVVAMAAAYESCVKDTLVNHASQWHQSFGTFANNNFGKLNSRVSLKDLHRYAKLFGPEINSEFKRIFGERKQAIKQRTGTNIENSYDLILEWRHAYAHAGIRNTTISEAVRVHTYAKRVLYCFDEAFHSKP